MEPVTTALIAAILAGAAKSAGSVAEKGIIDAYGGLKGLIQRKFGQESALVEAIDRLEANPDSEARKGVVREEAAQAKANEDPDLVAAAQRLLDQVQAQPGGQTILTATGNYIAQAAHGSTASVNINRPDELRQ